jgi:hypothetical protein
MKKRRRGRRVQNLKTTQMKSRRMIRQDLLCSNYIIAYIIYADYSHTVNPNQTLDNPVIECTYLPDYWHRWRT